MTLLLRLALLAFAAGATGTQAAVTVSFPEPENFRDASIEDMRPVQADEPALRQIEAHLQKLGARYLAQDAALEIEVLDVDLAGRFEPWRPRMHGIRFMDSLTWPSMRVRYTLREEGRIAMTAEERIADQMYLGKPKLWFAGEQLGYEKAMLDDWFRARFVEHRPPR